MIKAFFKELIIMILLIAAILLILTVLFYDSIPMNKAVPTKVTYVVPETLKEELEATLEEEQEVLVTYKIDDADLKVYQKNNSYDPGKADPFAIHSSNGNPTTDGTGTASGNTSGSASGSSSSGSGGNSGTANK